MAITSPQTAPTAGARKARTGWPTSSNSLEAARHRMQRLDAGRRDHHHLARLNTGVSIACDDIRLDHHSLARAERFLWHGAGRAALAAGDWRQIAATITVQKIVDDGEAGLLDHA